MKLLNLITYIPHHPPIKWAVGRQWNVKTLNICRLLLPLCRFFTFVATTRKRRFSVRTELSTTSASCTHSIH